MIVVEFFVLYFRLLLLVTSIYLKGRRYLKQNRMN